jgi:hypothetical protein
MIVNGRKVSREEEQIIKDNVQILNTVSQILSGYKAPNFQAVKLRIDNFVADLHAGKCDAAEAPKLIAEMTLLFEAQMNDN